MDVTISQKSPVLIEAEVNVAWENVSQHYQNSLNQIRQHAQLPGFRKGKAPVGIIKKKFRQEITDELTRKIVPGDMEAWIKEKDIKAVGQPRLHHVGLKENQHFHYCVHVEVLPKVELQSWKGIEAEKLNVNITDEMVDQSLEQQIKQATKKESVDRGIEDGDSVEMSLTVIDDEAGETLTDLDTYNIVPGGDGAHAKLTELILGLKKEDAVSKSFEGDAEESHFESWAGKKLTAHIEIKDVFRMNEPVLDDEFAKTQDCDTLDELKSKTRETLQTQAEEREDMEVRMRIVRKFMEGYEFDVPQTLVLEEARNQVQQQIMPYIQMMGDSFLDDKLIANMMQSATPQAAFKVRTDLVLEEVAAAEAFEVSEEELDKELEQYVEATKAESLEQLKSEYEDKGIIEGVKLMIKRRKALDAVVEAAKIEEVDELTQAAEEAVAEDAETAETSEATATENES